MNFTEIASQGIRQALELASGSNRLLGFNQFVEIALYHPEFGYYQSQRERVGRSSETDFFTASSLKDSLRPILLEASIGLLKKSGLDPTKTDWVEIGAEPGSALLAGVANPFASAQAIRLGEPITLEGDLVVFSNELFDAQPFNSVIYRGRTWLERMIEVSDSGLRIVERPPISPEVTSLLNSLPSPAPEGYIVDLPTGSRALIDQIIQQPWKGIFIALDYGKTWQAITHDSPQGTARAYQHHRQSPNLLENIGQQDLTCHICWDWMEEALSQNRFQSIDLESQESFVLKKAPDFVRSVFESDSGISDPLKGTLRQLIHPSLMGQKFQSLSAIRTEPASRSQSA